MPQPEPAPFSEWAWVARPERPNIRVHSVFVSWAGITVVRVGYTTPPNPDSQCEFWSLTIPEFYACFKPA